MAIRQIHGLWSSDLPRKGWVLQGADDLGELRGSCDWCGTQIRYVHFINHKDNDLSFGVGCICAERLTEDYVNPKLREKNFKKQVSCLKSWMKSPRWKVSKKGGIFRRDKSLFIYLRPIEKGFKIRIGNIWGRKIYSSREAAIRAVFDGFRWAVNKKATPALLPTDKH